MSRGPVYPFPGGRRGRRAFCRLFGWLGVALLMVSCVRTCVGLGELGSKERPAVVALEGWPHTEDSVTGFQLIRDCLEQKARYRVAFEIYADIEGVVESLTKREALIGVVNSASFVTVPEESKLQALFVPHDGPASGDRSIIIALEAKGSAGQGLSSGATTLQVMHEALVAYHSQTSDVGFLVGRQLLYDQGVLPKGAIFTSSWRISEELVRQGRVAGAVVSEDYLRQSWGVGRAESGMVHQGVVVLAVSPTIPARVVVAPSERPQRVVDAVIGALPSCATAEVGAAVARTMGGTKFEPADLDSFAFLRRVMAFQETFVRVLPGYLEGQNP